MDDETVSVFFLIAIATKSSEIRRSSSSSGGLGVTGGKACVLCAEGCRTVRRGEEQRKREGDR